MTRFKWYTTYKGAAGKARALCAKGDRFVIEYSGHWYALGKNYPLSFHGPAGALSTMQEVFNSHSGFCVMKKYRVS